MGTINQPINPTAFYIQGFSSPCNGCVAEALEVLNDYKTTKSPCCKRTNDLILLNIFYGLSDYWKQYPDADEICAEIEKFSLLISNNFSVINEYDSLLSLMRKNFPPAFRDESAYMAHKIATGCFGKNHLYFDMGYEDRSSISNIMDKFFPTLSELNPNRQMKWKKFLYKQICIEENLNLCPSPSCQECIDYSKCFHT